MPESGEWRFTYGVEIDAAQAKAAAQALRAIFSEALRDLDIGKALTGQSGAGGAMASQIGAVRKEMAALGELDLTKPTDELRRELQRLQTQIADTENRLLRMDFAKGSLAGHSDRQNATLREYYGKVQSEYGRDVANQLRAQGVVGSIGDVRAQFIGDTRDVTEFETSAYRQVEEKHRFTNAEMREMAALESEIYDSKLAAIRTESEILGREMAALDQKHAALRAASASVADLADNEAMYDRLSNETIRLAQEEQETVASLTQAKQRIADLDQKMATGAARQQGAIMATTRGGAGAVAYSQQVALTVRQDSVDKAEKLAEHLKEGAAAMQAMANARIQDRGRDLDIEREKATLLRNNAKLIAAETEAERTAGAQQRALLAQQTNAQRAAQTQMTAITRAESSARVQAEKAAATAKIEAEKRQTAVLKAELRERQQAARSASMMGGGGGVGIGLGSMGRNLIMGGLGALGLYGIEGTARTLYTAGKTGAQQQRIAETFGYLAEQSGISADAMLEAINRASRGTISDMNAISLSAQVLAQAFARSSDDIVGDTATLVQASRRLAQVYADENGQFLTTEAVFARLIKFVREGNKELVDQFGISNQRIADSLGISIEGLRGAEGAASRFQGVIAILDEEIARLGGATETTADKIEAAEASITNSMNRMRAAMAPGTATVAGTLATGAENVLMMAGGGSMEQYTRLMQQALSHSEDNTLGNAARERAASALSAINAYSAAVAAGVPNLQAYEAAVIDLAAAVSRGTIGTDAARVTADNLIGTLSALTSMHDAAAVATDNTSAATYDYAEAMAELTTELNQANPEMAYLITLANQASDSVVGLTGSVEGLTGRMAAFRGIQAGFLGALSGAAGNVRGIAGIEGALQMYQTGSAQAFQYSSMLAQGQIPPDLGLPPGMELTDDTMPIVLDAIEEMLTKPFDDMVEAERERKRQQDENARAWEKAANDTQSAWESAAENTVRAFEDTLGKIPGVFGTSKVTEDQMKMAGWGIYEPQADEYLRQLRDEVRNRKDYAGVDIYDAARRGGIDQGLPQEAILALFERKWEDQTLFADKANLDLFNPDAVRREFDNQKKAKAGRENILAFFGMDESIMGDLTSEFQAQLDGQKQQFGSIGADMAQAMFGGYKESIQSAKWFDPIVATITEQVMGMLNDAIPAQ